MPSLTMSTGRLMVRNSPSRVVPVRTITATKSSSTMIILAPTSPAARTRGRPSRPPSTPPPVPAFSVKRCTMYSQKFRPSGISCLPKIKPVAQNSTMTTTVIHTLPLMEPLGFSMAVMTAT